MNEDRMPTPNTLAYELWAAGVPHGDIPEIVQCAEELNLLPEMIMAAIRYGQRYGALELKPIEGLSDE